MASETPPAARRAATRFLRIAGFALLAVAVVGAAIAAFMSSRHFAAAVEAELARSMLDPRQRTLTFEGPLEIFFWPSAGFSVGRVSLSEAGSAQEFASLEKARFAVAARPLFHARIVVEDCSIEGLRAAIVKRRDGRLNIDDLFAGGQPSNAAFTVDAASVGVRHATLSWTDEASGTTTTANDLELRADRLQADTAARTLRADAVSVAGRVNGARLRLGAAALAASPSALAAERVTLDLDYRSGETALAGALNARLAVDPAQRTIALEQLAGDISLAHPRLAKPLKLPLRGGFRADRDDAGGSLATRFDDSSAALKFAIPRYAPPALRFDAEIDRLDVDRYLAPGPANAAAESSREAPRDFSALEGVELDGTARIGSLRVAGIETRNIRLDIRGRQGRLDVRGNASKGR